MTILLIGRLGDLDSWGSDYRATMPDQPRRRQWEYRVVGFLAETTEAGLAGLDEAGGEGWEAVGVIPKDLAGSWVLLKRELIPDSEPPRPYGFTGR